MLKEYFVYIVSSETGTLYVGMTNNLKKRVFEHRSGAVEGFSKKYKCYRLIYFESGKNVVGVIEREKQIKRWRRSKKEFLINTLNPSWRDLYDEL